MKNPELAKGKRPGKTAIAFGLLFGLLVSSVNVISQGVEVAPPAGFSPNIPSANLPNVQLPNPQLPTIDQLPLPSEINLQDLSQFLPADQRRLAIIVEQGELPDFSQILNQFDSSIQQIVQAPTGEQLVSVVRPTEANALNNFESMLKSVPRVRSTEHDFCREYLPNQLDPEDARQLIVPQAPSVEGLLNGVEVPWDGSGLSVSKEQGAKQFRSQTRERGSVTEILSAVGWSSTTETPPPEPETPPPETPPEEYGETYSCAKPQKSITPTPDIKVQIAHPNSLAEFPYPRPVPLQLLVRDFDMIKLACDGCGGGPSDLTQPIEDGIQYGKIKWNLTTLGSLNKPYLDNVNLEQLEKEIEELREKIKDLAQEINELERRRDQLASTRDQRRKKLQNDIVALESVKTKATTDKAKLDNEVKKLDSEIQRIKKDIETKRKEVEDKQKSIKDKLKEIEGLNAKIAGEPSAEAQRLSKQIEDLEKDLERAQARYDNTRQQNAQVEQGLFNAADGAEQALDQAIINRDQLAAQAVALQNQIRSLEGQLFATPLMRSIIDAQGRITRMANELANTLPGVQPPLNSIRELQRLLSAPSAQREGILQDMTNSGQNYVNDLRAQCSSGDCQSQIDVIEQQFTELNNSLNQAIQNPNQLIDPNVWQQLQNVRGQLNALLPQLQAAEQAVNQAQQAANNANQAYLDALRRHEQQEQAILDEIESLQNQIGDLNQQLAQQIRQDAIETELNTPKWKEEIAKLQSEIDVFYAEINALRNELDSLQKQLNRKEAEHRQKTLLSSEQQEIISAVTKDISNKRQELQAIETEDQDLENEIKLKKEALDKLQKDLEELLLRSSTLDGNKQASGMQNWFIPPPLEKLIKQPTEFDRYKKDVGEKEGKLAEAKGAKKALQKEAYSIIKDVTSALWTYKSADARVTKLSAEITELEGEKTNQQAENSRNNQEQLRQAQARKAEIDADKAEADQAVNTAQQDENAKQGFVDDATAEVETDKSALEEAESEAKAKRSQREFQEKNRAAKQRTVATARGEHESLLGNIRAQEAELATIERNQARQAAAGNDQGATNLAQAAAAARRQLESLQTQLESNRTTLTRAEADLQAATRAENTAVDEEQEAVRNLFEAQKQLRKSREKLASITSVHEEAVKRRQEEERKAKDLQNQSDKAKDNIDQTNQDIASSSETEELDKKIAAKNKEKESAENDKVAAEDAYNQLVQRRTKFYSDKNKADQDIAAAKLDLENAEKALKDYLYNEVELIDLEVVININDIDDVVIDEWRMNDQPKDKVLKIKYRGRSIVSINLEGADGSLEPPGPTSNMTVCNPSLAFDKDAAITAPSNRPKHKAQEPETVALWYQEGKPLYDMWPPVTRVFAGPSTADTGTQTRERVADEAAGAAAGEGPDANDSDQEEEVDKRRLMRSADWWTYGGADNDKVTTSCSPGGGTANIVGGGTGPGSFGGEEIFNPGGQQCTAGESEEDSLADITRSSWIGAPLTSKDEDEWMLKIPEVPGNLCETESELKVKLDDTGYQGDDDPYSGSDKYQHIPAVWGDKSKDVRDFDSDHKTQLKVQLYDGAHKGLRGETIEWRVLSAGPDLEEDKYGLTNARLKEKLDEKTDASGYSKLDFYLEADYGKAAIEAKWIREGTVCKTVNIDVKRLLELQKLDMGFGPKEGWEQGEEFFKDGTALATLVGKLPKETETVVVFGVGLVNDRFEPYDDAEIEFSQQASQDGVTIDPEKMKTRTYGLAWTRVTESPDEAELKLEAKVESELTDFTDPASVEGEQSTKTLNRFKIGPEGAQLTIETDESFVPGGEPWSGTGRLVLPEVDASVNHILKDFDKLNLKIDGLEVDPVEGEEIPVAKSGEVRWPGDDSENAFEFVRRGFKFTLNKLGLSAGNDGLIEGSIEIKTGSGDSDKASANFAATIGPNGFFGSLSDMPEITLAGMKLEKGANIDLDLHTQKDPSPLPSFGPGKTWQTETNHRRQGLLIRQASVILPEALKGANDMPPKLGVKDLLIGSQGISGEVTLQHTITAGMGQLNFAINEVSLKLSQNQPTGTKIKGAVKLPEPYVGEISGEITVDAGNEYGFSAKTETPVSAPQLGMVFHIQLLEARYANEKFNFEIKNALLKSESFSDFSINKFKFDSDGNFDAKLTFSDMPLKFANGFDIELKEFEFSVQEGSKYSIGVKSGFRFAAITADNVNFLIENGPTIKELEIEIEYDRTPVSVGGRIVYKEGLFEGSVDVDAKALSLNATLIMGSQKEPDKSTWTFWYVELNTRTVIPLGQSGVSIIELGGGVGYNYDPPIGSTPGAQRKTDTLSLKATMGLGDAPTTGRVFAGRTQLVLVSGRFSINGKVWVLNQESAIFGEGQLNFHWAPTEKVDGFVRMGLGIPDQAGKILAFNGDVGFRFNSASDWEIKSRQLDGSILERVLGEGTIDIKPGQVKMEGSLSYDIYKEVGISEVTLKAQVDLDANTSLNITISDNSSSLNTTAKFNGLMNLKLDTPVREFELAAARVRDSGITFNATQTDSNFSGSIAGNVDASWNVWGFQGSRKIDIGYNF